VIIVFFVAIQSAELRIMKLERRVKTEEKRLEQKSGRLPPPPLSDNLLPSGAKD
jgi:hypothetical protein